MPDRRFAKFFSSISHKADPPPPRTRPRRPPPPRPQGTLPTQRPPPAAPVRPGNQESTTGYVHHPSRPPPRAPDHPQNPTPRPPRPAVPARFQQPDTIDPTRLFQGLAPGSPPQRRWALEPDPTPPQQPHPPRSRPTRHPFSTGEIPRRTPSADPARPDSPKATPPESGLFPLRRRGKTFSKAPSPTRTSTQPTQPANPSRTVPPPSPPLFSPFRKLPLHDPALAGPPESRSLPRPVSGIAGRVTERRPRPPEPAFALQSFGRAEKGKFREGGAIDV